MDRPEWQCVVGQRGPGNSPDQARPIDRPLWGDRRPSAARSRHSTLKCPAAMPTRRYPASQAILRRQRGAAALLMILTLIVILTIVFAPRLTLWQVHNAATDRGYQALIDAKAAILAHAAGPDADVVPPMPAGRRLGQIS